LEEITASEAVDDILKAVEFLKNKGYVKIGLVGSSFGGFASLTAASKTADLYLLALKSPVSDYKGFISSHQNREEIEKWKKRGFMDYASADGQKIKINYAFFEDAEKITGYDAARKIKIPALIVHGDSDEAVPVGQSKKLATLIRSCSLKIIKGADHRYSKPEDFKKMLYLVSDFIIKNS
jgi:dipeptidyl aminopeptidase/acylaminoacyl peptidase